MTAESNLRDIKSADDVAAIQAALKKGRRHRLEPIYELVLAEFTVGRSMDAIAKDIRAAGFNVKRADLITLFQSRLGKSETREAALRAFAAGKKPPPARKRRRIAAPESAQGQRGPSQVEGQRLQQPQQRLPQGT
ncbi:MAG: hypothetical protein LCH39_07740 [Proteobacteria bacterium]|nr:hypothetical protein [Pseudomonadota bacterium]